MSLKVKLTSTILAFCLILGLLVMGVFASSQATVNLGGSLSFSATNVHAKVTGSVSGADNDEEANSKLPDLTVMEGRDSTAEASHDADVLSWADAGLQFNENGDAISIVLTIENLATDRPVYATISLSENMSNSVKSTITRVKDAETTSGLVYAPGGLITLEPVAEGNTSVLYFILKIELKDKNTSLLSTDKWGYDISLNSEVSVTGAVEETANTKIAYEKASADSIMLGGANYNIYYAQKKSNPTGEISIDPYITKGNVIYPVCVVKLGAFQGLSGPTSVTIPDTVVVVGSGAFNSNSNLASISLGSSVTVIEHAAFNACPKLESISVSENNKIFNSANNCNAVIETETNTLIVGCANTVLLDSLEAIGYEAFYDNGLTGDITLPANIKTIEQSAFGSSKITSLTIPEGIKSIGGWTFSGCSSLTTITIKATTPPTLGTNAFDGTSDTLKIKVPVGCIGAYAEAWGLSESRFEEISA